MDIIDPHIHLFSLSRGYYDWLKPENAPFWSEKPSICRDISENEVAPVANCGYVHIEAGFDNSQPWREIDWLQTHSRLPMRSVGGISLSGDGFYTQLDALSARTSVIGVRDILDDQAAELLRLPMVRHRLDAIAQRRLIFEAQFSLIDDAAVTQLEKTLDVTPDLQVVINHGGFPPAVRRAHQKVVLQWQKALRRLAVFPGVSVKLSGWEMQSQSIDWFQVDDVIDTALEAFGDDRVMIASNFPLVTFRIGYSQYWDTIVKRVPEKKRDALIKSNASRIYRFS